MKKKILIIEDDREMCMEFSDILINEGYEVDTAFDGLSGWDKIVENRYDLLCLDLKLPGLSGLEILKRVKQNKDANLKVFVLTGNIIMDGFQNNGFPSDSNMRDILQLADVVMNKPFKVDHVLKKIASLL